MKLSLSKRLVFSILPTVLLLATAETLVRLTGAAETCPTYLTSLHWTCDPILHFKARQDLAGGLNKQGFRGRDFSPKKPRTYRILALGDSCTFGSMAGEDGWFAEEPYPQKLEHLVAERIGPDKLEVLNGGLPGYNSYQGVMLLRTKLRGLQPDLITVRYGWNDHLMSPEGKTGHAFREPAAPWALAAEDLLLRTTLYPFARRLGMELRVRLLDDMPEGLLAVPREWKPNIPLQQYEHNLRRIVALAQAQSAEVWLLTSPSAFLTPEILARYEALPPKAKARGVLFLDAIPSFKRLMQIHDSYNAATRAVAKELNISLIDMAEVYGRHADQRLFSMLDVLHPTQAGYDLEAETLYTRLVDEGILVPSEKPPLAGTARSP